MTRNGDWNIWKHGAMPGVQKSCPVPVKALLIAAYRWNSRDTGEQIDEELRSTAGVYPAFIPLIAVVMLWLTACVPSLLVNTRSSIGTLLHIVFGVYLAAVYWILVCVTLAYKPEISILTGITSSVHFAWFCAPAHPDTVYGSDKVSHVMRVSILVLVYTTATHPQHFAYVRDAWFVLVIWAPEIVSLLVTLPFNSVVTMVVSYFEDFVPERHDE
jgi:hypothetical protein